MYSSLRKMTPLLVLLILASVYCSEEVYRIPLQYNGYTMYEDVVLDRVKNTMLVVPGNLEHIPGPLKSTINLHDFNTKYVAIKNVNKGQCTIVPTNENMGLADSVIYNITKLHQSYPPNVMHLLKSKQKMNGQQLLSLAGLAITNFCRGYSSYRAYPTKPGIQPLHRASLSLRPDIVVCMISPNLGGGIQAATSATPGKLVPAVDVVG